jgi:hypothetical protein
MENAMKQEKDNKSFTEAFSLVVDHVAKEIKDNPSRFNTKTKEYYKVLEAGKAVVDHYAKTDFMSDDFASSRISEEVLSRAWNAMENTNEYKTASFAVMWELDLKEEIKEYFSSTSIGPHFLVASSSEVSKTDLLWEPGIPIRRPEYAPSRYSTRRPDYKKVKDLQERIFNLLQDPKRSYEGIAETIAEALSVTFRVMNEELKPTWDQQKLALDTLNEKFKNKEEYYTIMNGVI